MSVSYTHLDVYKRQGLDKFTMVVGFLEPQHYTNPDSFVPGVDNTLIYEYTLSEEYPSFERDYIQPALDWWNTYVATGISPEFDEKKDSEILKTLRKNTIEPDDVNIEEMCIRDRGNSNRTLF